MTASGWPEFGRAGLEGGPGEAEQRKGLEQVALSFLLPQMGERPPVEPEQEYDDVEAREAETRERRLTRGDGGLVAHVVEPDLGDDLDLAFRNEAFRFRSFDRQPD